MAKTDTPPEGHSSGTSAVASKENATTQSGEATAAVNELPESSAAKATTAQGYHAYLAALGTPEATSTNPVPEERDEDAPDFSQPIAVEPEPVSAK